MSRFCFKKSEKMCDSDIEMSKKISEELSVITMSFAQKFSNKKKVTRIELTI